jgi:hypothetical protein
MELATRIVEEPSWFDRIKHSASTILEFKPSPLPDPEQRMREIVNDIDVARQSYDHWRQIVETIARAADPKSLQSGFDDFTTASHRSANVLHLATYRETYEQQYVSDMLHIARALNPRYDDQVLRGNMTKLPASEQAALRQFFDSTEWTDAFLTMLTKRGGTEIVPTDSGKVAVILAKAKYFKLAYEALGLSMFCDGARPNLKRKNDYNDIHQLLYVNDYSGDVLVSEDGGTVATVGGPNGKVLTFRRFLEIEAA